MAKVKHSNIVDIIDNVVIHGIDSNVLQLNTNKVISGRKLIIRNKEVIHFGNCNYLGLERHPKVKQASIEAIQQEGIRLTMSRAYVSSGYYVELEELLSKMYGGHVVVAPSSTMLHLSAIPVLFGSDDLVLLDHQVHASMTQAVQYKKASGLTVKTVRHNRYDILEDMIKKYRGKQYEKIWYVLDGIYSMYGDAPDMKKLVELMDKYPSFYLYVDDAHGCSWKGKHGRGHVLSEVDLHPKMMMTVSLGKGFGVIGGVLVTKDPEYCRRVRNCGNTMIFSAPLSSGLLGAAIASAKIHLTDELVELQEDLMDKIRYTNKLIRKYNLPQVKEEESPIFYIPTGLLKIAYNMLDALINDGYLTNVGGFPAVSVRCAGIRFLITCHIQKEDIDGLIERIAYHLPREMAKENFTFKELARSFKKPEFEDLAQYFPLVNASTQTTSTPSSDANQANESSSTLKIEYTDSISKLKNMKEWNYVMTKHGVYHSDSLAFMEKVFTNNENDYNNWSFLYYTIRDEADNLILSAFFTEALWKEDVLAPSSVSMELEQIRTKENPNYLISKSIALGCQSLEGEPLHVDTSHPQAKAALSKLVDLLLEEEQKRGTELIVFRDMSAGDKFLEQFFLDKGFVVNKMPNKNKIYDITWNTDEEFLTYEAHTYKRRKNHKKYLRPFWHMFEVNPMDASDIENVDRIYELYSAVKKVNFAINTFPLPKQFFADMLKQNYFDMVKIELKAEFSKSGEQEIVGFFCGAISSKEYYGMFLGFDYDYLHSHHIYRQTVYQLVKRGRSLGCSTVNLGFSADVEKRKYNAVQEPKIAYINFQDMFNQAVIQNMGSESVKKHY